MLGISHPKVRISSSAGDIVGGRWVVSRRPGEGEKSLERACNLAAAIRSWRLEILVELGISCGYRQWLAPVQYDVFIPRGDPLYDGDKGWFRMGYAVALNVPSKLCYVREIALYTIPKALVFAIYSMHMVSGFCGRSVGRPVPFPVPPPGKITLQSCCLAT